MKRYERICGIPLNNKLNDKNIENGLVEVVNHNLIATMRGKIILNTVIKNLLV